MRKEAILVFIDKLLEGKTSIHDFDAWMLVNEGTLQSVDWLQLYDVLSEINGGSGDLATDIARFLPAPPMMEVIDSGAIAKELLRGGTGLHIMAHDAIPVGGGVLSQPTEFFTADVFPDDGEFFFWLLRRYPPGPHWDEEVTATRFAMLDRPGKFEVIGTIPGLNVIDEATAETERRAERDYQQHLGRAIEVTSMMAYDPDAGAEIDVDTGPMIVSIVAMDDDSLYNIWEDNAVHPIWYVEPIDDHPGLAGLEYFSVRGIWRYLDGTSENIDGWRLIHG